MHVPEVVPAAIVHLDDHGDGGARTTSGGGQQRVVVPGQEVGHGGTGTVNHGGQRHSLEQKVGRRGRKGRHEPKAVVLIRQEADGSDLVKLGDPFMQNTKEMLFYALPPFGKNYGILIS